MKNQKHSIKKIVTFLNNSEEDGGLWLPNIQRAFVWSEEQICRLFDSVLREYPISTLLVWKTKGCIRRRRFIDNWRESLRTHLTDFYVPEDDKKKGLVLDGQQRLQSLYIGICGSFDGRELYFDILSGELQAPDDIKYKFRFERESNVQFPWVRFKDMVVTNMKHREILGDLEARFGRAFSDQESDKIKDHLQLIDRTFKSEEAITYQELDSIDTPSLYTEEDVVEIFIRANSGGTKLGKSDLLFSLLNASWEYADEKTEELLGSLNQHGFAFNRDFLLKTCLVLLGQGARYQVEKFRKAGIREDIEGKWARIATAIQDVLDYVRGKTYIQCDKALPSYLVLIPLIYTRYEFPTAWRKARDVDLYLLRCLLTGAFGGQPDTLLDALVNTLRKQTEFNCESLFAVIRDQQRSLELTEDRLWAMGYGSDAIHLLFNIWYREFNYTPSFDNNLPQVDHIFPQTALKEVKEINSATGRQHMKYQAAVRNQLANCMLLTREENGAGGKSDTLPEKWFAKKDATYLKLHLIPEDKTLWKIDHFEDFIEARKDLLRDHFKWLLVSTTPSRTP